MFTPEFVSEEQGEFVLLAAHSLESAESVRLSIAYCSARITFGSTHLPRHIQKCRVIYDIRGQAVPESTAAQVVQALQGKCTVEFKR
jgi:hypothetical protein